MGFSTCDNSKFEENANTLFICILLLLMLMLCDLRLDSFGFFSANAEVEKANKDCSLLLQSNNKTIMCM